MESFSQGSFSVPLCDSFVPSVVSLLFAFASIYPSLYPDNTLTRAAQSLSEYSPNAVQLCKEAIQVDAANAFRWADLGEAYLNAGNRDAARSAYARAVVLAPNIPAIRMRQLNYFVLATEPNSSQNEPKKTTEPNRLLDAAVAVLSAVPDYDSIIFSYLANLPPAEVDRATARSVRLNRAWLGYSIKQNEPNSAALAWASAIKAGFADAALADAYTAYLIGIKAYPAAVQARAAWLGPKRGAYPAANLLYPGGWRITPDERFETTVNTRGDVTVGFRGNANVTYDHASQVAVLPSAGRYRLSARATTEDLTTNEGIRLAIPDLNLATDSLGETQNTEIQLDFAVPAAQTVRVAIVRHPSQKFDSKIAGAATVSDITLARAP